MSLFHRWSRHHERHRHAGFDGRFGPFSHGPYPGSFGPMPDGFGPAGPFGPFGPHAHGFHQPHGFWPWQRGRHHHGGGHPGHPHHGHHHGHHGHAGGFGFGGFFGRGRGGDGRRGERLQARISAFLDLSDSQQTALAHLLGQLRDRRRAMRSMMSGPEVARLVEGDTFAREAAQQLVDAQIEALRASGPALVQAVGDFFDTLDFDQQQALRFMMRRLRRRGGLGGRGGRDDLGEV